jgi:hypothetical protein
MTQTVYAHMNKIKIKKYISSVTKRERSTSDIPIYMHMCVPGKIPGTLDINTI